MAENNAAALEAEATNTTREFDYEGKTYRVETDSENWPLEAMVAFEGGKSIGVVSSLLGEEQWDKFMKTKPKNKDFAAFAEKMFDTLGINQGE